MCLAGRRRDDGGRPTLLCEAGFIPPARGWYYAQHPREGPFKRGCWHQYWVASVPGSLHGGGHLTRRWRRHVAGLRRTELTVTTLTGNDDLRLLGRFFLVGL